MRCKTSFYYLVTLFYLLVTTVVSAQVPPSGKGLLVLIRPSNVVGCAVKTNYSVNGIAVGALQNKSYLPLVLDPGDYVIEAQFKGIGGNKPCPKNVTIQPNEVVYISQKWSTGLAPKYPISFTQHDGNKGKAVKDKCKLTKFLKFPATESNFFSEPQSVLAIRPIPGTGISVEDNNTSEIVEASKEGWGVYTNDVFSIQFPSDWESTPNEGAKMITLSTVLGDKVTPVTVIVQAMDGTYIEMDSYFQTMINIYGNIEGVEWKEKKQNIKGNDARLAYVNNGIRTVQYFLKEGNALFLFTVSLSESGYVSVAETLESMMFSLNPISTEVKIDYQKMAETNGSGLSTMSNSLDNSASIAEPVDFGSNKRDELKNVYDQLFDFKSGSEGKDNSAIESEEHTEVLSLPKTEKLKKVAEDFPNLKYRRSSLYTLMINDNTREHHNVIRDAFGNSEIPEKFNDHNVGPYLIDGTGGLKDQTVTINDFIQTNEIAKKLVARWFNRSSKGGFNMDLISERGQYNASEMDVKLAQQSQRGLALLSDAGEELIGNTFVIVNDYRFTNKEEVAAKTTKTVGRLKTLSSFIPGGSTLTGALNKVETVSQVGSLAAKGYVVKSTSYLYRLVWNDSVAGVFYNEYWTDESSLDQAKIDAFNNSKIFQLKLIGSQDALADLQSSVFTDKSEEDLIRMATVKATDKATAKLQRKYEEFQTKTPLTSVNPLSAKIGLKEGLEPRDKFEVLEQTIDKDGKTKYVRKAIIYVDKNQIWDNTDIDNEATDSLENRTLFKGAAVGGLYPGMLIRQIK